MKSLLPSNLSAPRALAILAAILTTQTQAILDTNANALSDLWEKQHNSGNLFAPTILATNDEDLDGWTNAQEAAAGTDPFNPNPPDGIVTVTITPSLTAEAFTLTWPTLVGKNYQLKVSTDLVTWSNLGDPISTYENTHSIGVNTIQTDNSIPDNVFWQVTVTDIKTDSDELTDAEEYALGTNSYNPDTDGDGTSDSDEMIAGTDPSNPSDAPETGWVILDGDLEENEEKTLTRTLRIPKGQRALLLVYVASAEYSYWTDPTTPNEFNDTLTWNIQPSSGATVSGSINVNARHENWIEAENRGLSFRSNDPIHIENAKVLSATETEDLTLNISLSATNISDGELPSTIAVALLPLRQREIEFGGVQYHVLKSDDGNTTYAAPHWIDLDGNGDALDTAKGERNYSAAFTRKTQPKVKSIFKIKDLPENLKIEIKATANDGISFPQKDAQFSEEQVIYPMTGSSPTLLPDEIRYYPKSDAAKAFKIQWEMNVENAGWGIVGESFHQIYVTLETPISPLRQETLFEIGCRRANGISVVALARTNIYAEFKTKNVKRLIDQLQLSYWKNNEEGALTTSALLSSVNGNGTCNAWAFFFRDILRIQGIEANFVQIIPLISGVAEQDRVLAVKEWNFAGNGSAPAPYSYVINTDATPGNNGTVAQNNPNPPKRFDIHSITLSGGILYDPSYGTPEVGTTVKDYEDASFAGFGRYIEISGGIRKIAFKKNDVTAESAQEVELVTVNGE